MNVRGVVASGLVWMGLGIAPACGWRRVWLRLRHGGVQAPFKTAVYIPVEGGAEDAGSGVAGE